MDRKKELKQIYKETAIEAGIYQIKNTVNNKVFIASTRNLKTITGKKFQLENGLDTNKSLQKEWNQFGRDAFIFEVLEVLKKKEEGYFDEKRELEKLEAKWLEQLQPFGERGYHFRKN
jgi:hypothetical protein